MERVTERERERERERARERDRVISEAVGAGGGQLGPLRKIIKLTPCSRDLFS